MNAKIVTYTGKSFDLLNPQPEMVCIEDIAHALAHICRYTGHVREFYSVAQHCVLMANADLPGDRLHRLLHDSAEAYIGDIARPWKQLLWTDTCGQHRTSISAIPVKGFEQKIQGVIGEALGIKLPHSAEVKEADNRMMATEIRDLMPESDDFRLDDVEPLEDEIVPWRAGIAEESFLSEYRGLTNG